MEENINLPQFTLFSSFQSLVWKTKTLRNTVKILTMLHLVRWICIYIPKFYISEPYKTYLTLPKPVFFLLCKTSLLILSVFSSVCLFQKHCSRQNTCRIRVFVGTFMQVYMFLLIGVFLSIFICFIGMYRDNFCVQIDLYIIQFSIWKN